MVFWLTGMIDRIFFLEIWKLIILQPLENWRQLFWEKTEFGEGHGCDDARDYHRDCDTTLYGKTWQCSLVLVDAFSEQVRGPVGHVKHGKHHWEQNAGYDVDALGPGRELRHPRLPARVLLRLWLLMNDLAHLFPGHHQLWTHQRLLGKHTCSAIQYLGLKYSSDMFL